MSSVLIGLTALLLAASPVAAQHYSAPVPALSGGCEIRLDAPYVNPRLPLGRAANAQRPVCRTTWAPGPAGTVLYVQGPPVYVEAPPVSVGGLRIYLVPPEIIVQPSEVTVEPPEVRSAGAPTGTPDGR